MAQLEREKWLFHQSLFLIRFYLPEVQKNISSYSGIKNDKGSVKKYQASFHLLPLWLGGRGARGVGVILMTINLGSESDFLYLAKGISFAVDRL